MITDGYEGYWWLRTAMSVYGWLQVFTSDYDVLTDGYRWLRVVGGGSVWLWGGNRWLRVVEIMEMEKNEERGTLFGKLSY